MLAEGIKITFCSICCINAVLDIIIFVRRTVTLKVTSLVISALISVMFSLSLITLGVWAVIKKNTCGKWLALIFTIISAFINLAGVVIQLDHTVDTAWKRVLEGKHTMYYMEQALECCGKNGPNDYPKNNLTIPKSCYPTEYFGYENKIYKTGCSQRWQEFQSIPIVHIITFFIQLSEAVFLGLLQLRCIEKRKSDNNDNLNTLERVLYGSD